MDIETFRAHCLAVKGASESLPFLGNNVLVFKIMDKMFAMAPLQARGGSACADMKCDPERSVELRERYSGIGPGHIKTAMTWNRITLDSDVADSLIVELIRHSVDEVVKALPKRLREEYQR
ncbi:MAG: MmcQ/YjbR family DNA-binding protein [Rikenellaceae bacterium]|nr:MmcQ/YjbR family DNA-binding protein [Rikenellaceae bacterium]